jgi:phage baseplate assembly protein W
MPTGFMWPISPPAPSVGALPSTSQPMQDAFGTDLYFDGNLRVNAKGDYQTVSGEDNLRRAVFRRLATNPGEIKTKPDYGAGLPAFVKRPITQASIDALRTRILEQLRQDRRIASVLSCEVQPFLFDGVPGVLVYVSIQALGRQLTFQPFGFSQEV